MKIMLSEDAFVRLLTTATKYAKACKDDQHEWGPAPDAESALQDVLVLAHIQVSDHVRSLVLRNFNATINPHYIWNEKK